MLALFSFGQVTCGTSGMGVSKVSTGDSADVEGVGRDFLIEHGLSVAVAASAGVHTICVICFWTDVSVRDKRTVDVFLRLGCYGGSYRVVVSCRNF